MDELENLQTRIVTLEERNLALEARVLALESEQAALAQSLKGKTTYGEVAMAQALSGHGHGF